MQIMVPQTQTVNTIETINKITEYERMPVNRYYAGNPLADSGYMGYKDIPYIQGKLAHSRLRERQGEGEAEAMRRRIRLSG